MAGFRTLVAMTEGQAAYLEKRADGEKRPESVLVNEMIREYLRNPIPPLPVDKMPPRSARKFFQIDAASIKALNTLCREFDNRTRPDLIFMAVDQAMKKEGG